jgi:hypothetical protein
MQMREGYSTTHWNMHSLVNYASTCHFRKNRVVLNNQSQFLLATYGEYTV